MAYSIRLTEEERGLADAYAKLNGISVAETSDFLKAYTSRKTRNRDSEHERL